MVLSFQDKHNESETEMAHTKTDPKNSDTIDTMIDSSLSALKLWARSCDQIEEGVRGALEMQKKAREEAVQLTRNVAEQTKQNCRLYSDLLEQFWTLQTDTYKQARQATLEFSKQNTARFSRS